MENVLSKPSPARVIFLGSGKIWSEHTHFLLQMANTLSSMLYQAVRGKIILEMNNPARVKFRTFPCLDKRYFQIHLL